MAGITKGTGRLARLLNRIHARLAARGRLSPGFVSEPEPRTIGLLARGRQLSEGRFLFGGHLVEDASGKIWDIAAPDGAFDDDRHGFIWLDDLAALGNTPARELARDWTSDWIERFGTGSGPGWRPGLTGRRVSRWISHSVLLTDRAGDELLPALLRSLSQQTHFLARRHMRATAGLPRFEALGGLIHASLSLQGMRRYLDPAIEDLADVCRTQIDEDGGLVTRNPQELLDVFAILTWTAAALSDSGRIVPRDHLSAIERIAPVLRALRHGDGGLARFHGGGRGEEGRLDQALAASGQRGTLASGLAMGYARLTGGRTSVIVDAAAPATGEASANAHASTLAFELTSGRRPLVVNCGSGGIFGQRWHRAGRATPSHSTLGVEGASSSQLGRRVRVGDRAYEPMAEVPGKVTATFEAEDNEITLSLSHDGYAKSHGVHHSRHIRLSTDGRRLGGEDELAALTDQDRRQFDAHRAAKAGGGSVGYSVRFHLHPDVEATRQAQAILLTLKSGEVWVFEAQPGATIAVEPSLYLEKGHLEPRTTKQIVLSGSMLEYATRVTWTLAKSADTPEAVRDIAWVTGEGDEEE